MTLAGPALAVQQELYDFIVAEFKQRAGKSYPGIRTLRTVLHNQRGQLLAFADARSLKPEQVGKRPKQLLTGKAHSHWLKLLGFERFQRA